MYAEAEPSSSPNPAPVGAGRASLARSRDMNIGGLLFSPTAPLEDSSQDEQGLVARLAAADPAAVGEVYDQHHRAVRAFASRLVGDAAAAEDLVHEVFVALPRAMRGYRFES